MMQNQTPSADAASKAEWIRPELKRLDAGAAESGEAGNFDSSSPQRS